MVSAEPIDQAPRVAAVLAGLKDFQRRTVDYVFRRLYLDTEPANRFLVADEVGLGKTLVARGVIAKAIEHLWNRESRIDVIYICSNADIARQNIRRLNVTGREDFRLADRIGMLPVTVGDLCKNRINFVSLTPGTSFNLRSNLGTQHERAVLFNLLREVFAFKDTVGPLDVLKGDVQSTDAFRRLARDYRPRIEPALKDAFVRALEIHIRDDQDHCQPDVRTRFDRLCEEFRTSNGAAQVTYGIRQERRSLVGDLRLLLAETCLEALEPDLIILDEFQRFKTLLDGEDDGARLARHLFGYAHESSRARVLLLSATPYKMYTVADEGESDDHYADFLRTYQFLRDDPHETESLKRELAAFRDSVFAFGANPSDEALHVLDEQKASIAARLHQVMVRTERLGIAEDRGGMLEQVEDGGARVESDDMVAYVRLTRLAELVGAADPLEVWKSAPYVLSFMEDYQFKYRLLGRLESGNLEPQIAALLKHPGSCALPREKVLAYEAIDPGNSRLRGLAHDVLEEYQAWRWLWIPPTLPYYRLSGVYAQANAARFTKRLVFSAWRIVPKVIATLVSYEAERRMIRAHEGNNPVESTAEARASRRPLLQLRMTDGRAAGMPVLALMYPSTTLARVADPLELMRAATPDDVPTAKQAEVWATRKLERLLTELPPSSMGSDRVDERWYWAAPILLDLMQHEASTRAWFKNPALAYAWSRDWDENKDSEAPDTGWREHVAEARKLLSKVDLGRQPRDLAAVLGQLALAAPGTAALRALGRIAGGPEIYTAGHVRTAAARVGWASRRLFNAPEVTWLLRGLAAAGRQREPAYWRTVLRYCVDGGLQAVLDEYAHMLRESLGMLQTDALATVEGIAAAMSRALSLRVTSLSADTFDPDRTPGEVHVGTVRLRGHIAVRYGEKTEDTGELVRSESVRDAFNSPFWPFVLATTSVGQEGLDFHPYCHAVVHWNVPTNPVDLEQREGRVHRYKGHAVRKNLARREASAAFTSVGHDPWAALFDAGVASRATMDSDLIPYWVYPLAGGAHIERHVPALPLSRDLVRLQALRRSLVLYRMVFGQPQQEDLITYLQKYLPESEIPRAAASLRIDLSPPVSLTQAGTYAS
jgi:hypothetical protein